MAKSALRGKEQVESKLVCGHTQFNQGCATCAQFYSMFSPYHASRSHGAYAHESGINWSYATFNSPAARDAFEKQCNSNGYRTRNAGGKGNAWYVQYHHIAD